MNPAIVTKIGHADPNATPLNINELIDLLNQLITSDMQGTYIPYVIGATAPGVNDRDKAWIKLDSGGRPIGIMIYYNGNWRRVYNGMPGEIRQFSGDPTITTDWDPNGAGIIGGWYDGWQICNGKNGSPNLTDKFIVAAHLDNSGGHSAYANGWQTFIDTVSDKKTGGVATITLGQSNTYRPASKAASAYIWTATGNAPAPDGDLFGFKNASTNLSPLYGSDGHPLNDDPGNPAPDKINIVNPFIAMGYMIFQGYA